MRIRQTGILCTKGRPALAEKLQPVVEVKRLGGMGNYMMEIMTAYSLASRVTNCIITGEGMPEWELYFPHVPDRGEKTKIVTGTRISLESIAAQLESGEVERIVLQDYLQHIDNFLPRDRYESVFRSPLKGVQGTGPGSLLINIRGAEILDSRHPNYVLLPIEFYQEVVRETGLTPVFLGQLDQTPYVHRLRRTFPHAQFVPSQGAVADFETIRRSRFIIPAISTFSWLASWLSNAERIFFPVCGQLSPFQAQPAQLLPLDDSRYAFYLFPANYSVGMDRLNAVHGAIVGRWRRVSTLMLRSYLEKCPRVPRSLASFINFFDEEFYLRQYGDVAHAVEMKWSPDARHHYWHYGFYEGRQGFALDGAAYAAAYPLAALEIGQGDFADPAHHYAEIGHLRGYSRFPDLSSAPPDQRATNAEPCPQRDGATCGGPAAQGRVKAAIWHAALLIPPRR